MATEIKLPDMGEGITDITVVRWRVPVGGQVKAGDIIIEVATDKVDTEVPAAVDGVLLQINAHDGELVPVTSVFGYIGAQGEAVGDAPASSPVPAAAPASASAPAALAEAEVEVKASPVAKRVAADKGVPLAAISGTGPGGQITKHDVIAYAETSASGGPAALPGDLANEAPLVVRRAAADFNVDLDEVAKGKPLSTLTKYDVLSFAATRASGSEVRVEPAFAVQTVAAAPIAAATGAPAVVPVPAPIAAPATPAAPKSVPAPGQLRPGEELVKLSRMRQAIAKNTSQSIFTAPHVTTMWDVDMSAAMAHRAANKGAFAKDGVNLTLTAYFIEAIVAGLRKVPAANASWTDDGVIIKRYYNIGMATALPMDANGMGGLIVPVIKNAGELNLLGIARAVNELAERARKNELRQEDLADGTFTLSNYGTSGSRFQTPVIVQPQAGILGVGAVEKRAVIISNGHPLEPNMGDALVIKPMTTLGFSYDHRILDGATADAFCAAVKAHLEGKR